MTLMQAATRIQRWLKGQDRRQSQSPAPSPHSTDASSPIGVAWMEGDRTIYVRLRAEGDDGTIGDAHLMFGKRHRRYEEVLRYLGGLTPDEAKRVYEWDFTLR